MPFASFTRRVVVDFVESYPQPHQQSKAATVLQSLFKLAQYYGIVEGNQAAKLRLQTSTAARPGLEAPPRLPAGSLPPRAKIRT